MSTKECKKCKQVLSIDSFSKNKTKKDGLCNFCKKCHKIYFNTHYKNNKTYYLEKSKKQRISRKKDYFVFKAKLECCRCGEKHIACLDFHHIDESKKINNISSMFTTGASKDSIKKELEKCIVLCSNCHRKEHYGPMV